MPSSSSAAWTSSSIRPFATLAILTKPFATGSSSQHIRTGSSWATCVASKLPSRWSSSRKDPAPRSNSSQHYAASASHPFSPDTTASSPPTSRRFTPALTSSRREIGTDSLAPAGSIHAIQTSTDSQRPSTAISTLYTATPQSTTGRSSKRAEQPAMSPSPKPQKKYNKLSCATIPTPSG